MNLTTSQIAAALDRAENATQQAFDVALTAPPMAPELRAKLLTLLKLIVQFAAENRFWLKFLPKKLRRVIELALEIFNPESAKV